MITAVQLVVFDMDGTLTVPTLDFDQIRREIGITRPVTILEELANMSAAEQERAMEIVTHHERIAAQECALQPGVHEVVAYIRQRGIHTAIATRNSRRSATTVTERHRLRIDHIHTREDGPVKPSPDSVLRICEHFSVCPEHAWVVGDYLYDIQAGAGAGATTVLLAAGADLPEYSEHADHVIRRLIDLVPLMENKPLQEG